METRRFEDFEAYYREMDVRLRPVLTKYYPEAAVDFVPPSLAKIRGHFEGSLISIESNLKGQTFSRQKPAESVRRSLRIVAMIRYIDDFIDDCIWQQSDFTEPEQRDKLKSLLDELLLIGQKLDPTLSADSFAIFKTEIQLASKPSQKNLNANFRALFEAKPYDVILVYCQVHNVSPKFVRRLSPKIGIADVFRDFYKPAHGIEEPSTDFDLYKYIKANNLDPTKLIEYVERVFQQSSPELYDMYQAGYSIEEIFHRDVDEDVNILIIHGLRVLKSLKKS